MTNPEMGVEERIEQWLEAQDDNPEIDPDAEPEQEAEVEESEEQEAVEAQPEQEEEFTEVEYEGKTYKLPPELKDAVLRQADYTRKTQEVAEMRKQTEAAQAYLQQQHQVQQAFIKEYASITALDNQLAQYQEINWQELIQNDPVEALKLDHQMRQLQRHRDERASQLQQYQAQAQQQQQAKLSEQLQHGAELLAKEIPGWSKDLATQIKVTGKDYGFTDGELDQVYDPRMVKVLHDAMKFRQLQANKGSVAKKVAGKPPVLKAGTVAKNPNAEQINAARSQLRKSGKMDDAAKLIEKFL